MPLARLAARALLGALALVLVLEAPDAHARRRWKRRGVDCPRLLEGADLLDLTGFKSLRQDQPPWGKRKMPTQRTTFTYGGCLITSYTMALWFYGVRERIGRYQGVTPITLDRFSRGNHLIPLMARAVNASGDRRWRGRVTPRKRKASHAALLAQVQANFRGPTPQPIVAKVCAHRRSQRVKPDEHHRGRHYVLIVGVDKQGEPIAFDPGWETQCKKQGGPTPWNRIMKRKRYYLAALYWLQPKPRPGQATPVIAKRPRSGAAPATTAAPAAGGAGKTERAPAPAAAR